MPCRGGSNMVRVKRAKMKGKRKAGSVVFFFHAEGGIRDRLVTGVQTCALPISAVSPSSICRIPGWWFPVPSRSRLATLWRSRLPMDRYSRWPGTVFRTKNRSTRPRGPKKPDQGRKPDRTSPAEWPRFCSAAPCGFPSLLACLCRGENASDQTSPRSLDDGQT